MTLLYTKETADVLTQSEQTESWRLATDKKKTDLILQHSEGAQSLLDIGCGWGQILLQLVGKIPLLVGVDESADRLAQLKNNKYGIKTYQSTASALDIDDKTFDRVLTSHIIHEIKLFGTKEDLMRTFSEIRRVLRPNGRYFIIDHLDPGEGMVTIRLQANQMNLLNNFVEKFRYRKVDVRINVREAELSLRDCQDFVTKIWAFDNEAEELEMIETHTIMKRNELEKDLLASELKVVEFIPFNSIQEMLTYYSIELIKGTPWNRQFMLVAKKV